MRSHVDPSIAVQLSLHQSQYWLRRDIDNLDAERKWLKKRIKKLGECKEASKCRSDLLMREEQLELLRKYSKDAQSHSIELIDEELLKFYSYKIENHVSPLTLVDLSPRLQFLLHKRLFLESLAAAVNLNLSKLVPEEPLEESTGEKRSRLRVIFDIGKKFIDILDDAWSVLKSALPPQMFNLVGPFLTGGVGFIIHIAEAWQGIKEAWLAVRNKNDSVHQRKTRGITGVLIFMFGCVGAGLSLSFIAGAIGAAVSGMTLMPMLIPVFLLSIYSTALLKRSYILHEAIRTEKKTKVMFERTLEKIKASHEGVMDEEFSQLHIDVECQKHIYEHAREERLKAERNVAFNVIEVVASAIVLIGTVLGLSALIGAASFASFGIAPLTILVIGVAIGLFCKAFERIDEKRDFNITRNARDGIINLWNKLFHRNTKALANQPPKRGSTSQILTKMPMQAQLSDNNTELTDRKRKKKTTFPSIKKSRHTLLPGKSIPKNTPPPEASSYETQYKY